MNYEHTFHAGNAGDVLKHIVLLAVHNYLLQKPTALFALDTHAGAGMYSLNSDQALKTKEAETGIQRLSLEHAYQDSNIEQYRQSILTCRKEYGEHSYPGSPWLIAQHMRPQDRLAACELKPDVYAELKSLFIGNQNIALHNRDGYAAMHALLPPKFQPATNRGLVLIDPPYELQAKEFSVITASLEDALKRWPQACYLIWYPIKQKRQLQPFYRQIKAMNSKSALAIELLIYRDDSPLRMNGSGMMLINPPWQFDQHIQPTIKILAEQLSTLENKKQAALIEWLRLPS